MSTLIIVLLLGLGVTAYLYGVAVCKGAQLVRVEKSQALSALLFALLWFVCGLSAGYFLAHVLLRFEVTARTYPINGMISLLIFAILSLRMFIEGFRNSPVAEERMDEKEFFRMVVRLCLSIGVQVFLTGFAMGLLEVSFREILAAMGIFPILGILAGLRTGYFYGYWQRIWAYFVGGLLVLAGDIALICALY